MHDPLPHRSDMEEEPPPPYPGLPHEKECLNDEHPTGQTPSAPPLPTEADTSQGQDAQIQVSQGYGQPKTRSENSDVIDASENSSPKNLPLN